jgi:NB-ARC domain
VVWHASEPVNLQCVLWTANSSTCTACRGDDLLVEEVRKAVLGLQFGVQHSGQQIVGLELQLQQIRAALAPGEGMRLHGLCGLGGVGKSTLARQFFRQARIQHPEFTRHAYVDVGEDAAMPGKQLELLQQIGCVPAEGSGEDGLRAALRSSFKQGGPLLLVLDNLWRPQQLAALLGCEPHNQFQLPADLLQPGSRVLITSREATVVSGRIDGAAEPQRLAPMSALAAQQLLCLHAFGKSTPASSFSEQQMADAQAVCGGLPLTLRLLGGALAQHASPDRWQVSICASQVASGYVLFSISGCVV